MNKLITVITSLTHCSYANALFRGTIMGCILINVTIELFKNSLYRVDE